MAITTFFGFKRVAGLVERARRCRHQVEAPDLAAGFAALRVTLGGSAVVLGAPLECASLGAMAAAWWLSATA